MTNDLFAGADPVVIDADGDTFTSGPVANAALDVEPGEQGIASRTAWWVYIPASDGYLTIDTSLSDGDQATWLVLYAGSGPSVDTAANVTVVDNNYQFFGNNWAELQDVPVAANHYYYVQVGVLDDTDLFNYVLRAVGPASTAITGQALSLPPIELSFSSRQDDFIDAEAVHIAYDGGDYESGPLDVTGYTLQPGEPDNGRTRSAWWRYTPLSGGVANVDLDLSDDVSQLALVLYTGGSVTALTQVLFSATGAATFSVTAGTTYRLAVLSNADTGVQLRVTGPATLVLGDALQLPPISVGVSGLMLSLGVDDTDAPPIDVTVTDSGRMPRITKAPPIDVNTDLRAPTTFSVRRLLIDPRNATVVPSLRPQLTVGIDMTEGARYQLGVDVQYSTDPTFATGTSTLSTTYRPLYGVNAVILPVTVDLTPGLTYSWRARLTVDGAAQSFTAARTFTVDPGTGDGVTAVAWIVTAGLTDPHLWFVRPTSAVPGTAVTAYGTGFPANAVVKLGGTAATVTARRSVPATAANATPARDTLDAAHDEIDFVVPDVTPPGGPLTIEGDDTP